MAPITRAACPRCHDEDRLLYHLEPTDHSEGLACPDCIRTRAKHVQRVTACDRCRRPGAWRDPAHRRNEYLCGGCHVTLSGTAPVNRWFARVSNPIAPSRRPHCTINNNDCRGEVRPRAPLSQNLCTRHAGRRSAAWDIEDGIV